MPKGLWVVATPIGNLADLSERGRQALGEADAILCEDTRRTGTLLSALGISRPLLRLDAHATPARIAEVVRRMSEGGEALAFVTDAGTPGISDPGAAVVAKAREAGVPVIPIPGPSAVVALLSISGFNETSFVFRGFFPRKENEREKELEVLGRAGIAGVAVWFESPQRISESMGFVAARMPDARALAAKELTKIHEHVFAGTAAEVASGIREEIVKEGERGEWCFAIRFPDREQTIAEESSEWVKALECLLAAQVSASMAAKQVSQHFGVPKNRVYEAALRISGKKSEGGG